LSANILIFLETFTSSQTYKKEIET